MSIQYFIINIVKKRNSRRSKYTAIYIQHKCPSAYLVIKWNILEKKR